MVAQLAKMRVLMKDETKVEQKDMLMAELSADL